MIASLSRGCLGACALLCVGCLVPVGYPFGGDTGSSSETTTGASGSTGTMVPTGSGGSNSSTQDFGETTAISSTGDSSDSSSGEVTSTSTGGNTTDDGTTGAEAYCGDSVINGPTKELPYAEECDDGNSNDDDGCHLCLRDRVMFISSKSYHGYELSGLSGADNRCRGLAAAASLRNPTTFKAWLSDSQMSAGSRMVHGLGRYVLVNGVVLASSWDALVGGQPLQSPINVTEQGMPMVDGVWTGTNPNGSAAVGADHCADWSKGAGHEAFIGWSDDVVAWTLLPPSDANPDVCDSSNSIYCVEQ